MTYILLHDWYRYQTLGFEPAFVNKMLDRFSVTQDNIVLDPFCGSGTTLITCMANGISSLGIEAHPFMAWVSDVKINVITYLDLFDTYHIYQERIIRNFQKRLSSFHIKDILKNKENLLIKDSINLSYAEDILYLAQLIRQHQAERPAMVDFFLLALAKTIRQVSNLVEKPEVTVSKSRMLLQHDVLNLWHLNVEQQMYDLHSILNTQDLNSYSTSTIVTANSIYPQDILLPSLYDYVITSPPYLCEKDYTRTTRLEHVLLSFRYYDLARIKENLLVSNSKAVGVSNQIWRHIPFYITPAIRAIADEVEYQRGVLGKKDGFSRKYPDVILTYFEQLGTHLSELRPFLKPGAKLAYVLGDQASYFGIPIKVAELLAEIAEPLGYHVDSIEVNKERKSFSKTKNEQVQINENILFMTYPGVEL